MAPVALRPKARLHPASALVGITLCASAANEGGPRTGGGVRCALDDRRIRGYELRGGHAIYLD
jgi:hypothetical protein